MQHPVQQWRQLCNNYSEFTFTYSAVSRTPNQLLKNSRGFFIQTHGTENYRIGGAWSSPWEDKWWQCHSDCALSWLITEGNYHYFPLLVSINPLARHITKLCVIICSSVPQVQSICPSFLQCQHSPHLTWTMLQLSGAQIFLGTFWHQVLGLWSPDGDSM